LVQISLFTARSTYVGTVPTYVLCAVKKRTCTKFYWDSLENWETSLY